MLQSLFKRAEATVDNAIASMLARALVAIPFLIAGGFGTAALAIYAYETFGVAIGNLAIAIAFCVVGLITAAVVAARDRSSSRAGSDAPAEKAPDGDATSASKPLLDPMDKDVMAAVATAALPVALPLVLRSVMRNLPLLAAVAAAGFVLSRNGEESAKDAEAPMQPAE